MFVLHTFVLIILVSLEFAPSHAFKSLSRHIFAARIGHQAMKTGERLKNRPTMLMMTESTDGKESAIMVENSGEGAVSTEGGATVLDATPVDPVKPPIKMTTGLEDMGPSEGFEPGKIINYGLTAFIGYMVIDSIRLIVIGSQGPPPV